MTALEMRSEDYPSLYRAADDLSKNAQSHFFGALLTHLLMLVAAAAASIIEISHWLVAVAQLGTLLGALACSVYLFAVRPDRQWYGGRAAAESIKTITWRYMCCAEPFQRDKASAADDFRGTLRAIIDQNRGVFQALCNDVDGKQITPVMEEVRNASLSERRLRYSEDRVADQLKWYSKKATDNRRMSSRFFWTLIGINVLAVGTGIVRIVYLDVSFWPTNVLVAAAASVLSWMQAKRYSELAASYSLASHEISLIKERSLLPNSDEAFSIFVGDAENAFSREHTQWVARKDV